MQAYALAHDQIQIGWTIEGHDASNRPEWRDDAGTWFRAYGNENWEFDENGLMKKRYASINDLAIDESERRL